MLSHNAVCLKSIQNDTECQKGITQEWSKISP